MALAEGGVKYTLAQALTPNTPNARTSVPTRRKAAQTIALAPPGKLLVFSPGRGLENLQMKKAKMICEAKNEIPASAIVSSISSSIGAPWVAMSGAIHHVCRRMGIAEAIAITKLVTAKNFVILTSRLAGYRSSFLALFQSDCSPSPKEGMARTACNGHPGIWETASAIKDFALRHRLRRSVTAK